MPVWELSPCGVGGGSKMAYVRARKYGMGACGMRRGLGDCINVTAGVGTDSVTGEACVMGTPTTVTVLPGGSTVYNTGGVVTTTPQTFSQWMSANGTMVGIGVAVVFGFLMLSRSR